MNFWGILNYAFLSCPGNDPKFSDRQVYANSVDPDQTPVQSGFTMFAILSASFWLIMSKNDPDQEWWLQFFLYSNL